MSGRYSRQAEGILQWQRSKVDRDKRLKAMFLEHIEVAVAGTVVDPCQRDLGIEGKTLLHTERSLLVGFLASFVDREHVLIP